MAGTGTGIGGLKREEDRRVRLELSVRLRLPTGVCADSLGKRDQASRGMRAHAHMGANTEEFGLALYPEVGSVDRVRALLDAGREAEAKQIAFLSFYFDGGPAFAVRALEDALGLNGVPVPLKVGGAERLEVDAQDLLMLAAAMLAVAALVPGRVYSAAEVRVGPLAVTTRARVAS